LRYVQNDPPATVIDSAHALNVLLADLQRLRNRNVRGPVVPIDPAVLGQINVRPTGGNGNPGLLRGERWRSWPLALAGPDFKEERGRVDALAGQLVKQAAARNVDPDTLDRLTAELAKVRRQLADRITELPTMEYIHASEYLDSFKESLKVLAQPDVARYFDGT